MKWRRSFTTWAVLVAVSLAGACGSSSSDEARSPVTVFDVTADPGSGLPTTVPGHPIVLTRGEVRSALNTLLSAHARLVAAVMHQVGAGDDHPTEAITALAANSRSLTDAIAEIYGSSGAHAFAQLWEQHTQFFVDYAAADRAHDDAAKTIALRRLLDYQQDFASFVSTATADGGSLVAVTNLLHTHVEDLTGYIDADTSGHTATARRLLIRTVAHMYVIAGAISDAIAKQHLASVRP